MKKLLIVLLASLMYFNTVTCVNVNAQAFGGLREELTVNNNVYYPEEEELDGETLPTLPEEEIVEEDEEYDIMPFADDGDDGDPAGDPVPSPITPTIIEDPTTKNLWTANAYYVDEADPYVVHKEDDFHLIYQIEFHADTNIPQYAVRITVPALLLTDRSGNPILPSDVAVPKANTPEYDPVTKLLTSINYQESKNIGFNYYIEHNEDDGKDYLVFFNYKELAIGTSAAFQVLYKNLEIMELIDSSKWDLPVTIDVNFKDLEDPYKYTHQHSDNPDLIGDIDSRTMLATATKKPYRNGNKSYTPALYTRSQVDSYISSNLRTSNYSTVVSNFNDYRYAVWTVSAKVTDATQPYFLELDEKLIGEGKVLGFSSGVSSQPLGMAEYTTTDGKLVYRIWDNHSLVDKQLDPVSGAYYQKEKNITYHDVRVVVAYPRSTFDTDYHLNETESVKTWTVTNNLDVRVQPVDNVDPLQTKNVTSEFIYKEYKYTYEGDHFGASKSNSDTYNGWTNAYKAKSENGLDLGGIPFTFSTNSRYYNSTHYTSDVYGPADADGTKPLLHAVGDIKENQFVRLTAVDDLVYIARSKDSMNRTKEGPYTDTDATFTLLNKGDYYYEKVTVNVKDTGYDIYEDASVNPTKDPTYIDKGAKIYAMYEYQATRGTDGKYVVTLGTDGKPVKTVGEVWEEVKTIDPVTSHTAYTDKEYVFADDEIARHPYRVMAIHESNGYQQYIDIKVSVALKGDSLAVKNLIIDLADTGNNNVRSITLENNGGILAQTIDYNTDTITVKTSNFNGTENKNHGRAPVDKSGVDYKTISEIDPGREYVSADATDLGLYPTSAVDTTDPEHPVNNPNYLTAGAQPSRFRNYYYKYSPNTQGFAWLNAANAYARTNKNATVENDPINARINVRYNIVAYDGYEIYSQNVINYMKETNSDFTGHKEVVFYDLLPLGVEFDPSAPIIAGRLADANEKQVFKYPEAWDKNKITVTVDPDKDVVTNFNGTGQTLVIFHVKYAGSDSTIYTESRDINNVIRKLWIEGYGISYGAYYIWENINLVEGNDSYNIFAFTTDKNETNKDIIGKGVGGSKGSLETYVYTANQETKTATRPEAIYDALLVDIANTNKVDIWKDSTFNELLYGKASVKDIYARSSQAEIIKGVRADDDSFGAFSDETEVRLGQGYSYEIIVRTAETELNGLVVYDQVENTLDVKTADGSKTYQEATATKQSQIGKTFDINSWYGTFNGINTRTLILQGVDPIVYYSKNRNAKIPSLSSEFDGIKIVDETATKSDIDTAMTANKWVREDIFLKYYTLADVKAYAIDMRTGTDGKPFVLPKMTSISYRTSMISPEEFQLSNETTGSKRTEGQPAEWAYNNASYSASFGSQQIDSATLLSNSTRIRQIENDRLVVEKKFKPGIDVPENFINETFEFTVTFKLSEKEKETPFANKAYYLEKYKDGAWISDDSVVKSTDVNGKFYLKADERAVFKVSNRTLFTVTETESPFWKQEITTASRQEASAQNPDKTFNVNTRTFVNTFRPFLYLSKTISEYGSLDMSDREFEFTLYKKNLLGNYVPAANVDFWRVKSAYNDATIPERLDSSVGHTDEDGKLRIKANETIALFAGLKGDEYKIVENTELNSDFELTTENNIEGVLDVTGNVVGFNNRYILRNLYITKTITHLTKPCNDAFTFKVDLNTKDEEGQSVTEAVVGNRYYILDDSGEKQYLKDSTGAFVLDSNGDKQLDPAYTGVLDDNGEFTATIGNKKVLIEGLIYGNTYTVSEKVAADGTSLVNGQPSQYRPLSVSADAKMPTFSLGKDVFFTNDYLLRPLRVTKTVVSRSTTPDTTVYYMRAYIDSDKDGVYELLTNKPYINSNGTSGTTADDGKFPIKGGETVTFDYLARQDVPYKVEELWNGGFVQIYPAQGTNTAGKPVDSEGKELTQGTDYQNPLLGSIAQEGSDALIINGESGILLIGKEYFADSKDVNATSYLNILKNQVSAETGTAATYKASSEAVTLTLKVSKTDGTSYVWPKTTKNYTVFNLITNTTGVMHLEAGKSIKIDPWVRILVDDLESGALYILSESKEDTSKMYLAKDKLTNETGFISIEAENDTINGNPKTNPIATVTNEISSYKAKSSIMKYMKPGSDPVTEGETITFRVEEYNAGSWTPKADVEYIITEYDAKVDETYYSSPFDEADLYFASTSVEKTAADGKIVYYKNTKNSVSLYPRINFVNDLVYITLDENKTSWANGDLRLVEVMNESDSSWGQWYSNTQAFSVNSNVAYITNSNREVKMDLTKKILEDEVDDGRSYTFILNQVTKKDAAGKPAETMPGAGVSYEVLDSEGNQVDTRVTPTDGSITLKADQVARISFADGTVWTFTEVQDSVYRLAKDADLTTRTGTDGEKLGTNLVMVGAKASVIPVMLKATPNSSRVILSGGQLANTFTVVVTYSDGTTSTLTTTQYTKEPTAVGDGSYNVHFTYTENGVTVTDDVHLIPTSSDDVADYYYQGTVQTFVAPVDGVYMFEAWGASGGGSQVQGVSNKSNIGKGAYTRGYISLHEGDIVYVYVGGKGADAEITKNAAGNYNGKDSAGGYNGGGIGTWDHSDNESAGGGGGATDFRLVSGQWNNFDSLKSRIMVAAGGGGQSWNTSNAGFGGGFNESTEVIGNATAKSDGTITAYGATQTNGYKFGEGENGSGNNASNGVAGGGGGYYGGFHGNSDTTSQTDTTHTYVASYNNDSAAGGSSYVSGYAGCNSISKDSELNNITHTGSANHYSNKIFDNSVIIPGNSEMPDPNSSGTEVGHTGDGHARITLIENRGKVYTYTGGIQEFTATQAGYYKLEAWGAQGGSALYGEQEGSSYKEGEVLEGGHGGYSVGYVFLEEGETIYVSVGGQGNSLKKEIGSGTYTVSGGWNGGGSAGLVSNDSAHSAYEYYGSGGGATSFQTTVRNTEGTIVAYEKDNPLQGKLSSYSANQSEVLLVAGGGGGSGTYKHTSDSGLHRSGVGGAGGGLTAGTITIKDNGRNALAPENQNPAGQTPSTIVTDVSSGQGFGQGANGAVVSGGVPGTNRFGEGAGGGGGWYGGTTIYGNEETFCYLCYGGGGGSGYVSPALLDGKTIGGNNWSGYLDDGDESTTGNLGNGMARVTYVTNPSFTFQYSGTVQEYTAPKEGYYKLETWGAQGGSSYIGVGDRNATQHNDNPGAKGGYSVGMIHLNAGEKLYVVVGGAGGSVKSCYEKNDPNIIINGTKATIKYDINGNTSVKLDGSSTTTTEIPIVSSTSTTVTIQAKTQILGGYNGGGNSSSSDNSGTAGQLYHVKAGAGGGATHIAKASGLLSELSGNKESVLIVAGGGGGSGFYNNSSGGYYHYATGGAGGGLSGGDTTVNYTMQSGTKQNVDPAAGGSQTSGYGFGAGGSMSGGGWYGGTSTKWVQGGSGGSGYVSPSLVNGNTVGGNSWVGYVNSGDGSTEGNTGNGVAKITYVGQDY